MRTSEGSDTFYALVRLVGRFWLWFLFKAVRVRNADRVPARGPVLLCINHPNNLIDSLLVGAAISRKVHYLATAALFRNPLQARFLTACGAIPIYRRQDDPDKMDRNADVFAACFDALDRGRLIGIYPEGTTHAERRVQRIKTGAARIALEYQARREQVGGAPLTLIPVGLVFEARKSFRATVRVSFGEPIRLSPYKAGYAADTVAAVNALTEAIQLGMEAEVVHVDRVERDALARAVERIYRGDLIAQLVRERGLAAEHIDPLRLSQSVVDAVAHFETREPERAARIRERLDAYQALLNTYGVRDDAVTARFRGTGPRSRVRYGWQTLGLPVFLYGAVVNALPYLLPRWLARSMASKETDYATTRLLASVVSFPLFWGGETWAVWRSFGPLWGGLFLLSLPVSGLLAYGYLGSLGRLRARARLAILGLIRRDAVTAMIGERRALAAELERAKADYLSATRGSSF